MGRSDTTRPPGLLRWRWSVCTLALLLALSSPAPGQDFDADGVLDDVDNCAYQANDQADTAGVAGAGPDLIGDACQCGDVDRSGGVGAADLADLRLALVDPTTAIDSTFCNVRGPTGAPPGGPGTLSSDCDLVDRVVLARALDLRAPGIEPVCRPAVPHLDLTPGGDGVQQTVDAAGGQVEVSSAGVRYTLQVPAGALARPVALTLTPLTGVSGLPLSGFQGPFAAELGPAGLQFAAPVTLEIEVPAGVSADDFVAYAFAEGGARPHLFPQSSAGSVFTLRFNHFSGFGVDSATCEELTELAQCRLGMTAQECALQRLEQLRSRPGCGGPAATDEEVRDVLRQWYRDEGTGGAVAIDTQLTLADAQALFGAVRVSALETILEELISFRLWIDNIPVLFGFDVGSMPLGVGEFCGPWASSICQNLDELFVKGVERASRLYSSGPLAEADLTCFQTGGALELGDDDTTYLRLVQLSDILIEFDLVRFIDRSVFETEYSVAGLLAPKMCGVLELLPETQRHFLTPGETLELTVAEGFGASRYELPAPGLDTRWEQSDPAVASFDENQVSVVGSGVTVAVPELVHPPTATVFYETANAVEIVAMQRATFSPTCLGESASGFSPITLPCADTGMEAQGNVSRDGISLVDANASFPGFLPSLIRAQLDAAFSGPPLLLVAGSSSVDADSIDVGGSPFNAGAATTGFLETAAVILPTEPAPLPVPAVPILIRLAARGSVEGEALFPTFTYSVAAGLDVLDFSGVAVDQTIDGLLVDVGEVETVGLFGECGVGVSLVEAGSTSGGCSHGAGLTIEFDQDGFDALLGPLTYPLEDHFEIVYSPNLPLP